MQNRPSLNLPVVFSDAKPIASIEEGRTRVANKLLIYDVTYLHIHQYLELGLCLEGEGTCQVEDKQFSFSKGDVQVVFPYQRHISKSAGDTPSVWYWANIDVAEVLSRAGFLQQDPIMDWMQTEMALCGIIDSVQYGDICQSIKKIFAMLHSPDGSIMHPETALSVSLIDVILKLCQASQNLPKLVLYTHNFATDIMPALDWINQCLQDGNVPKVGDLPLLCNMSPTNFRRVFKNRLGIAPKDYITACCIHKVKKLLVYTNLPIGQIALTVGFEDNSVFNRCFLNWTGTTPSQFRKQYSK